MNRLSQTLTYAGISGTLPSLKEQLNSKNFPKYTIPQTYYESYLSILAVKKNPLVQGTLKATKEGKIKLINFSDPLNDSDKKSILFDAITTDKNGYATMNIPYGVWKFHQVNTTTGYEKIYDFFITEPTILTILAWIGLMLAMFIGCFVLILNASKNNETIGTPAPATTPIAPVTPSAPVAPAAPTTLPVQPQETPQVSAAPPITSAPPAEPVKADSITTISWETDQNGQNNP